MQKNTDNKFSILSLDGGGIRGIFSTALLAALEDDLKIKVTDHFDLIAGTSTGGIIAVGLGLGFSPTEILDFYLNNAKAIFPWHRRLLPGLFGSKYSNAALIRALKETFQEKKFGHSSKRLIIPSYSLTSDNVYNFRTAHHSRLTRDYKVDAWKVAAATSAAPSYFPAFKEIDSTRLIDGGVWANNPSMVAITEAVGTLGVQPNNLWAFSLGTTTSRKGFCKKLDTGGKLSWASNVSRVFLSGQRLAAHNQAEFFLGKDKYQRTDFIVPGDELDLDSIEDKETLFAIARDVARHISPEFKQKFVDHKAAIFAPEHYEEAK